MSKKPNMKGTAMNLTPAKAEEKVELPVDTTELESSNAELQDEPTQDPLDVASEATELDETPSVDLSGENDLTESSKSDEDKLDNDVKLEDDTNDVPTEGTASSVGMVDETEVKAEVVTDPTAEFSIFAKSVNTQLIAYCNTMAPNYPLNNDDLIASQIVLQRTLVRIAAQPDVTAFQESMYLLFMAFRNHPETFSPRYINRGMANVPLSSDARKQFELLMFILPLCALEDGVKHFKNYGDKLLTVFLDEQQGQRIHTWVSRVLGVN